MNLYSPSFVAFEPLAMTTLQRHAERALACSKACISEHVPVLEQIIGMSREVSRTGKRIVSSPGEHTDISAWRWDCDTFRASNVLRPMLTFAKRNTYTRYLRMPLRSQEVGSLPAPVVVAVAVDLAGLAGLAFLHRASGKG